MCAQTKGIFQEHADHLELGPCYFNCQCDLRQSPSFQHRYMWAHASLYISMGWPVSAENLLTSCALFNKDMLSRLSQTHLHAGAGQPQPPAPLHPLQPCAACLQWADKWSGSLNSVRDEKRSLLKASQVFSCCCAD